MSSTRYYPAITVSSLSGDLHVVVKGERLEGSEVALIERPSLLLRSQAHCLPSSIIDIQSNEDNGQLEEAEENPKILGKPHSS